MFESARVWWAASGVLLAACVAPAEKVETMPPVPAQPIIAAPVVDENALAEQAKALLAQAETDVQRARAKRALWLKAWEDLLAARQAVASKDNAGAIRHAKRASELAQLGLEQLAYPAVK